MEAAVKYENCEDAYHNEVQQESAIMSGLHEQYYGERMQSQQQQHLLHTEQQSAAQHSSPRQSLAQSIHSQQQSHISAAHQAQQRHTIPEVSRQRPTHPDFAHLRQSNAGGHQTRQINSEISPTRLNSQEQHVQRPTHSQTRQSIHHLQHSQNHNSQYTHAALKRGYHHIENGYAGPGYPSSSATAQANMGSESSGGGAYYSAQNLINVAQHTQNFDLFSQSYPTPYDAQIIPNAPLTLDGKSPKRYKKGEASLLFSPPFFKILPLPFQLAGMVSPNHKDAIAAQCYACGRIVRGNKSISSNFIKHMKRSHPEISKIYDTYKIFRIKAGIMPNLSSMLDVKIEEKSSLVEEGPAAPEDANDSNDESSPYFDPTTMLDVSEMIEDDNHSENSENAEDSTPSGEPSESNEPSKEHQQEHQQQHEVDEEANERNEKEIPNSLMEAINKMMDSKLKDFAKLSDLTKITENMKAEKNTNKEESNSSLCSHSDVEDLKKQMDQLKHECVALRLAVQKSQAGKRRLQQELQIVDKMLHQKKLIIRHIKIDHPAEPQKSVQKLFKDKLLLENIEIAKCAIIPTLKNSAAGSSKECVIVELENPKNVKAILRETHKLKDTGIFIEPEISPFQRKRKNKLMVLRKELLRRASDIKVLVRNTTLVVNSKNFYWDDVDGLCHTGNSEALELSGTEYLKSLTGLDLTEFVSVLKNYDVQLRE